MPDAPWRPSAAPPDAAVPDADSAAFYLEGHHLAAPDDEAAAPAAAGGGGGELFAEDYAALAAPAPSVSFAAGS